ncbi:MAG: glycosyltransferase, partial [Acidimicrobiia bacterium]
LLTGNIGYVAGVNRAVAWFLGDNDTQVPMYDPQTGGGYDGLECDGRNDNQGAESTIALISTLQQGLRLIGGQS